MSIKCGRTSYAICPNSDFLTRSLNGVEKSRLGPLEGSFINRSKLKPLKTNFIQTSRMAAVAIHRTHTHSRHNINRLSLVQFGGQKHPRFSAHGIATSEVSFITLSSITYSSIIVNPKIVVVMCNNIQKAHFLLHKQLNIKRTQGASNQ